MAAIAPFSVSSIADAADAAISHATPTRRHYAAPLFSASIVSFALRFHHFFFHCAPLRHYARHYYFAAAMPPFDYFIFIDTPLADHRLFSPFSPPFSPFAAVTLRRFSSRVSRFASSSRHFRRFRCSR
jgi:hypothetical protein